MANRHEVHSNLGFEFEWTASGNTTVYHNWTCPNRHARRAASGVPLEGHGYMLSQAAGSFVWYGVTATGKGRWLPDVLIGDFA